MLVPVEILEIQATVDGRNPKPVNMWVIPLFTGFIHPKWLGGCVPSTLA